MPTGYTYEVKDGNVTEFREFALRCARAMGAGVTQRDEDSGSQIKLRKVDEYYLDRVEVCSEDIETAERQGDDYWAKLQEESIAKATAYRQEYVAERDRTRSRYESMLEQARSWEPPTEEHRGLKDFMIQQLEDSIEFDCGSYEPSVPEALPVSEYRKQELGRMSEELSSALKRLAEETERVRSQNEWVLALRDSL